MLVDILNRCMVSSVGRAPDFCAGGLWFVPQTGPTLGVVKELKRLCYLCTYICKWLDVQVSRIRTVNPRHRLLHLQCNTFNRGHYTMNFRIRARSSRCCGVALPHGLVRHIGLTSLHLLSKIN